MIVDFIVSVFFGIATAILGVFPAWEVDPPNSIAGPGIDTGIVTMSAINKIVPLDVLVYVAGLCLAGWLILKGIALVVWLYDKVMELLP